MSAGIRSTTLRKAAVLIGINYEGDPANELQGCINDAENMRDLLTQEMDYPESSITMLTDHSALQPTYGNIITQLRRLADQAQAGALDEIWLHYSGHGVGVPDRSGDERDGQDEALVPLDHRTSGLLLDDTIYETFVKRIPEGVNVITVMDCCHSGTVLDLQYRYRYFARGSSRILTENPRAITSGRMISISGCRDSGLSGEAVYHERQEGRSAPTGSSTTKVGGAMSLALLTVLQRNSFHVTCQKLMEQMNDLLREWKFSQKPQLTTSLPIDSSTMFSERIKPVPMRGFTISTM